MPYSTSKGNTMKQLVLIIGMLMTLSAVAAECDTPKVKRVTLSMIGLTFTSVQEPCILPIDPTKQPECMPIEWHREQARMELMSELLKKESK